MRITPQVVGNGFAWIGILALVVLAFCIVLVLGFPGVLVLGLLVTLVCVRAELSEATPTWGREVFEARSARGRSPEERAALREEEERLSSPLRYYRRCGLVLVAAGLAGTAWTFLQ